MKNKIGKILLIVLVYFTCILDVGASNNLLVGKNKWIGFFSGDNKLDTWTGAKGKLESNSIYGFNINMSSIGHWVSGDPYWHFGAQAQLINQKLAFKMNKYYRYKANILSDKDRKIFVKITEVEMNSVRQKYEDIDNVLFEKWVTLKAGVPYELDETFLATSQVKRVSLYYAVGWKDTTDLAANSANAIRVKDISITKAIYDYKKVDYKNIRGIDYCDYYNIVGNTAVSRRKKKIQLRLSRPLRYVTEMRLNGRSIGYLKTGNTTTIPVNELNNEYNDILVYTKTSQQNKDLVFTKLIIRNNNITKYKNHITKKINNYNNKRDSKQVNSVIKQYKREMLDAKGKNDINRIFDEFKINYNLEKSVDLNRKVKVSNSIYIDDRIVYKAEFIIGLIFFLAGVVLLIVGIKRKINNQEEVEVL